MGARHFAGPWFQVPSADSFLLSRKGRFLCSDRPALRRPHPTTKQARTRFSFFPCVIGKPGPFSTSGRSSYRRTTFSQAVAADNLAYRTPAIPLSETWSPMATGGPRRRSRPDKTLGSAIDVGRGPSPCPSDDYTFPAFVIFRNSRSSDRFLPVGAALGFEPRPCRRRASYRPPRTVIHGAPRPSHSPVALDMVLSDLEVDIVVSWQGADRA